MQKIDYKSLLLLLILNEKAFHFLALQYSSSYFNLTVAIHRGLCVCVYLVTNSKGQAVLVHLLTDNTDSISLNSDPFWLAFAAVAKLPSGYSVIPHQFSYVVRKRTLLWARC